MDKLDQLDSINEQDESSCDRLIQLSNDIDEEVRYRAVEKLYPFKSSEIVRERLRSCLSDDDELVRVAAIEIIELWGEPFAKNELEVCLADQEWLVRGGAALALVRSEGRSVEQLIIEKNSHTECEEEKLRYIASLYLLDNDKYIDSFLSFFASDDYRVRSATANLLAVCVSYKRSTFIVDKVISSLEKALLAESSIAAKSSIKDSIEELRQF